VIVNVDLRQKTQMVEANDVQVQVTLSMGQATVAISLALVTDDDHMDAWLTIDEARAVAVQLLQAAELAERTGLQAEDE
jgi:hypothetical protein